MSNGMEPNDMEPGNSSGDAALTKEKTNLSYSYDNRQGWRRWRVFHPGRGMYHDVKRRLPYYWSDITDAFTYRVVASTIRMYFVKYALRDAFPCDKG